MVVITHVEIGGDVPTSKPDSASKLFDQLFKQHLDKKTERLPRSPLKRLQSGQADNRTLRTRKQLSNVSLGTPSTDEQSPQQRTSWRNVPKKKRNRKKTEEPNLFDSVTEDILDVTVEDKIVKKQSQVKKKTSKKPALKMTDQVAAAFERANLENFDDLPELNVVAEEPGASYNPTKPDDNIEEIMKVFEVSITSSMNDNTSTSNTSRSSSRRGPVTPRFGRIPEENTFQAAHHARDSISPIVQMDDVQMDLVQEPLHESPPKRMSLKTITPLDVRRLSSACSVRTDIFERDLNRTNLASTPIIQAPTDSRAAHRLFNMKKPHPVSRIKASLRKPISLVPDPLIKQLISTPMDKTVRPLSSMSNVSGIRRPSSASNVQETGIPSRYSDKTVLEDASKRSSSRLKSKKIDCTRSLELSLDGSSGSQETMLQVTKRKSVKQKSVVPSAEHLELPSFSEVNKTTVPRTHFQKSTPNTITEDSSREVDETVRLRLSSRTYSRRSESAVTVASEDISSLTAHSIDLDLLENPSLFLQPKTPALSMATKPCPSLPLIPRTASSQYDPESLQSRNRSSQCLTEFPEVMKIPKRSFMSTADVSRMNMSRVKSMISEGFSARRITMVDPKSQSDEVITDPNKLPERLESFVLLSKTRLAFDGKTGELSDRDKVLALCEPKEVTSFKKALSKKLLDGIRKIGEGSYGEIYLSKTPEGTDFVLKLIPFYLGVSEDNVFKSLLPEIMICNSFKKLKENTVNFTPNFIDMISATIVQGKFPKKLVDEWNAFDKRKEGGSENYHPKKYKADHLHCLMILNNGGTDVESFQFFDASETLGCFFQIVFSLAAAEAQYEFEHRDLHWGNVLVKRVEDEPTIDYYISGSPFQVKTGGVKVSIIDFSLSRMKKNGIIISDDLSKQTDLFRGDEEVDYQFEVYRMMRDNNGNDWEAFNPKSNIFWLDYMLHKMIDKIEYLKPQGELHRKSLQKLVSLRARVMDFESAKDFAESNFIHQLL
jgi:hypothetical protein